ncbi:TLC domain-containing protein [Aspergillus stella-maris]|uniref:TLC domain-containing protein n=1 Tax=Aspergillus stella-maris TaxID=1810926 RepID=UPI003CCCF356
MASKQTQKGKVRFEAHSSSPAYSLYVSVIVFIAAYYVFPAESNPLHPFLFLSYRDSTNSNGESLYGKGPKDLLFVSFYGLVLFAARDFTRQIIGRSLASILGIKGATVEKFTQQLWQGVYFTFIALFGLYVMTQTPMWYFHMPGLFEGFPHRQLIAPFKVFYLLHSGNWIQQAAVTFLGLEKSRKDNFIMSAHHVVTLLAIPLVYMAHMTHFALVLIIPHDVSDALLAFAKCISYATKNPYISMPYFALFVGNWIYWRHYIGGITFWTLLTKYRPAITEAYGWEDEQWKAATLHGAVTVLFGALQVMNAYWLFLILRITVKSVFGGEVPTDERESEEEGDVKTKGD